ncbi:MAG: hypothetical protein VR73_07070 [Gammaproteobacteria bacterium BRH_c0]|nr:MAG: hypothetical protein VR73_07070 [Gammaproteobacteria bacterium BRH_c0]
MINSLNLLCAADFSIPAKALADRYGFVFGGERDNLLQEVDPLVLWLDESGLSVRQTGPKAMGPVQVDFATGSARHRRLYGGGKSQSIAKAVGLKDKIRPVVADLTAGLGGDAFALASLGATLIVVERQPVVAALLEDGLARARLAAGDDPDLASIMARINLVHRDAKQWLLELGNDELPDVIYLDPMFPERRKSAQVNKSMQVFHKLVGADADADELLPLALQKARFRVVVKRPSHAPWLDNREPGYALEGKSVRFDIYPLRSMVGRLTSEV